MENKPPSRGYKIGSWGVLLAAVGGVTGFAWLDRGWETVVWMWVPVLVFFGPIGLALRYGWTSLGKRSDGRRSWGVRVLLLPYLLLTRCGFELALAFSQERAFAVAAPNLAFGRRLTEREAKGSDFVSVLDLAAEFIEVRTFRRLPGYCSLPVFDTTAPTPEQLRCAVDWLRAAVARGPVYVHCALGHGRSACVVVAYLLATGTVANVAEGMKLLRGKRPRVRLSAAQKIALRPPRMEGD